MIKHKIVHYCERGNERRDCTVRAVAAAFNLPYTAAHQKMEALGRKPRRGFQFELRNIESLGNIELRPELSCQRLEAILPALAAGRYIVKVPHHVFAVIDGEAQDLRAPKPKQRVQMVYEVTI